MSQTSGEWSDEISALEKVMEVYNALGGEQEEQLSDLVTPFRRLLRTENVMYRAMPFSSNPQIHCKLYIFRDLILIATELESKKKKKHSTIDRKDSSFGSFSGWLGSLTSSMRRSSRHSVRQSTRSAAASSTHSASWQFKLVARMELDKTTVKRLNQDTGFQLNHVYRQRTNGKLITKIDMIEIWCPSYDEREDLFNIVTTEIDHLREEKQESTEETVKEDGIGTQRKWARGKNTLRRGQSGRWGSRSENGRESRSESSNSADSIISGAESVSGLSLSDLESRYQVDIEAPTGTEAEFAVTFGDGPMGFSLSSGSGLGVIVGKVADDSMASVGGVEVGDRVIQIAERVIGLEMKWRDCVEIIKTCERPVEIKFVRNFKVNSQMESAEEQKANTPSGNGQRSWAKKKMQRTKSFGATIISLGELEKMYKSTGKQTGTTDEDDEDGERNARDAYRSERVQAMFERLETSKRETVRACGSVLHEIFETEKAYVRDLRSLIGDYMIPLRRTVRRVRCKDRKDGSTFCEHRTPRIACSRLSSDSRPVLEPSEIRDIFLNVETLVKVNTELLGVIQSGLRKLTEKEKEPNVTDIVRVFTPAFVRVMPFFKMYSLYCHQYPVAIDKLLIARTKNKELNQLLKAREDRSETTLQSLLIKPVQRICKYPLLFQSLLKSIIPYVSEQVAAGADMDTLEHLVTDLEKALETVDKIAKSVNEKVGEQESLERMMEIYAELGGEQAVPDLVSPHRRFLDKFEVLVRRPPFEENTEPMPEFLYVFNDHLVFATPRSGSFSASMGSLRRNNSLKKMTAGREKQGSLKKIMSFGSKRMSSKRSSDGSTGSGGSGRTGSGRMSGSGGSGSLRKSGGVLQPHVTVSSRIDLRKCQAKAIDHPDDADCYGFTLTFVGRMLKDGTPVVPGRHNSLTDKVVTTIDKFEIWLSTEAARDDLLVVVKKQLEILADQDAQTKHATSTVGPVSRRKTRDWKTKTRTKEIERKYQAIRKASSGGPATMTA